MTAYRESYNVYNYLWM